MSHDTDTGSFHTPSDWNILLAQWAPRGKLTETKDKAAGAALTGKQTSQDARALLAVPPPAVLQLRESPCLPAPCTRTAGRTPLPRCLPPRPLPLIWSLLLVLSCLSLDPTCLIPCGLFPSKPRLDYLTPCLQTSTPPKYLQQPFSSCTWREASFFPIKPFGAQYRKRLVEQREEH